MANGLHLIDDLITFNKIISMLHAMEVKYIDEYLMLV